MNRKGQGLWLGPCCCMGSMVSSHFLCTAEWAVDLATSPPVPSKPLLHPSPQWLAGTVVHVPGHKQLCEPEEQPVASSKCQQFPSAARADNSYTCTYQQWSLVFVMFCIQTAHAAELSDGWRGRLRCQLITQLIDLLLGGSSALAGLCTNCAYCSSPKCSLGLETWALPRLHCVPMKALVTRTHLFGSQFCLLLPMACSPSSEPAPNKGSFCLIPLLYFGVT